MFTEERYNIILQELKAKGIISVVELVKLLDASESTVRRDLNNLHNEGLLKKIHGGATLITTETAKHDYKVNVRKSLNTDKKIEIAKYAASLIEDGELIYLDAGTTTEALIQFIEAKDIIVVTNAIVHAKKLLEKNIRTLILGGELKTVTEAIVGPISIEHLKKYNFTKGFFGTNGVTNENGYTTPDINEAMVKSEAIKRCNKAFVLCDESKLNEVSFITFAAIKDAEVITNRIKNTERVYDTNIIEVKKE
ncbi:DeoR/GlpR family DNA-binding transcription regulator [Clostridium taeniosporum]|uniref:DeoR/GlpR transcriptional regulator n=1 Tax=Clostridium taeniosporum TaxID=394958 RepID=A0A1D7XKL9_9CLOT|nr:DeoR/GlpR family DNA-binding transcription regulator [Clostridium taeniosporum]AOR23837.1 DeoR/GlpR transcriptional regulator [Clostridium taeniosporum]